MNLSSLTNFNTSSQLSSSQTSTQAASSTSQVSRTITSMDARLQTQLDITSAQLSSFGKLKSAVSDTQLAARALGNLKTSSTAADIKTALQSLVTRFNTAITTAHSTATSTSGALMSSSNANRVSRDLNRALANTPAAMDALKKIGLKPQADGTLTFDTAKFDAAQQKDASFVQNTLAQIGQALDKTAANELASGGGVSDAMSALNQQSTTLKAHQSALLAAVQKLSTTQSAWGSSTSPSSAYSAFGVAAYQSNG